MLPAIGALGALSGLLSTLNAASKSSAQKTSQSNPFESTGSSSNSPFSSSSTSSSGSFPSSGLSPEVMQALLAAQSSSTDASNGTTTASKSRDAALKDLFSQLDGDGNGAISKGEFEDALGAGGSNVDNADKVFAKLDTDGDGSVSAKELAAALTPKKPHQHDDDDTQKAGRSGGSGNAQALDGASSTSVTNADGSVTTSVTYADGSKVTMTSAATGSSSSSATSSYNFIEQLIQRQAAQLQAAATSSLSVSA